MTLRERIEGMLFNRWTVLIAALIVLYGALAGWSDLSERQRELKAQIETDRAERNAALDALLDRIAILDSRMQLASAHTETAIWQNRQIIAGLDTIKGERDEMGRKIEEMRGDIDRAALPDVERRLRSNAERYRAAEGDNSK